LQEADVVVLTVPFGLKREKSWFGCVTFPAPREVNGVGAVLIVMVVPIIIIDAPIQCLLLFLFLFKIIKLLP